MDDFATIASAIERWFDERRIWGGNTTEEFNALNAADDDLRLYLREGNGLLVWRAYSEFRAAGLPIPETILQKLDQWAHRLEQARGQAEVAAAIEMTGPRGGAQGASQLKDLDRRYAIASEVNMLLTMPGRKISASRAIEKVAERRGMEASHVKSIYYAWVRPSKVAERKSAATNLNSVMRAFGK